MNTTTISALITVLHVAGIVAVNISLPYICDDLDVIFVVDGSASVSPKHFDMVKEWLKTSVADIHQKLGPRVQLGILEFSNRDQYDIPFRLGDCSTTECMTSGITNMTYLEGLTYTAHALNYTLEVEFPHSKRAESSKKLIIVMTDGEANEREPLEHWSEDADAKNINVFVVVVGSVIDDREVKIMARVDENIFKVPDFTALPDDIVTKMARDFCQDNAKCDLGAHNYSSIETCVNFPGKFSCEYNDGYYRDSNGECSDIDECQTNVCHNKTCTNVVGAYYCSCEEGYLEEEHSCSDIDECELGVHNCRYTAICTNIPGKFSCECNDDSYRDSNGECSDLNCTKEEFVCTDGSACLRPKSFCDGLQDCRDGSDEHPRILPLNLTETGIPCRQSYDVCLLRKNQQSKRNVLCTKYPNCTNEEFACEDGSACLPVMSFCDGLQDCRDGSDEISVNSRRTGTPCRRDKFICLLPSTQLHRRDVFCTKNATCSEDEFPCADKAGCLPTSWFCDGRQDCRCFLYPYIVIPIGKLCNGLIDCPDLSDECMCKTRNQPGICEKVSWKNGWDENPQRTDPVFKCQGGNGSEIIIHQGVCNRGIDCADGIDEANCSAGVYDAVGQMMVKSKNYTCRFDETNRRASRCDGVPECKYDVFHEECDCSDPPDFCRFTETTKEWSYFFCNTTSDWDKVHRTGFVYGTSICDGVSHCSDQEDELHCSNRTHFYCTQGLSSFIPKQKKCDRVVDCEDESDESLCNFKCPVNEPVHYIRYEQVCDGVQNCEGGYDECKPDCITSTFSNNSTMIKDKPVLVCLLFISTFALSGNSLVILTTLRDFFFPKKKPFVRDNKKAQRQWILINRVLILNLAVSDLLVGIYTFAICIKNLITDGEYCLVDRDWRSGTTCSVLGALLVIGSQQSVFTMILVTASRLLGIRKMLSDMPLKRLLTMTGLAWIVSVTLAVIPLLPSLEDTFTTSIWYEENALFATIEQNDIMNMTMWLLAMANSTGEIRGHIGSWGTLEDLIGKLSPNLRVGRKYGFYSSHTVCIPDLFPDRVNNASWWYSLLLILINFLAFVFILVGCFLIYRHATRKNPVRSAKQQTKMSSRMQKKLTVIVATDFLCWIPVCIMAFLQLSGVPIPQDWRIAVGLIIIPINSAVNPVIYSNVPEMIWSKIKRFRVWICSCVENCIRERPLPPAAHPGVIQEETAV